MHRSRTHTYKHTADASHHRFVAAAASSGKYVGTYLVGRWLIVVVVLLSCRVAVSSAARIKIGTRSSKNNVYKQIRKCLLAVRGKRDELIMGRRWVEVYCHSSV